MKNKKVKFIILSIFLIICLFFTIKEIIPIIKEKDDKKRVFTDMQDKSNDVISGIVGIIRENDVNGFSNYSGIGSGVIFDKKDNTYYIITAKHVIDFENSKFKIFTWDTDFSGQTIT